MSGEFGQGYVQPVAEGNLSQTESQVVTNEKLTRLPQDVTLPGIGEVHVYRQENGSIVAKIVSLKPEVKVLVQDTDRVVGETLVNFGNNFGDGQHAQDTFEVNGEQYTLVLKDVEYHGSNRDMFYSAQLVLSK